MVHVKLRLPLAPPRPLLLDAAEPPAAPSVDDSFCLRLRATIARASGKSGAFCGRHLVTTTSEMKWGSRHDLAPRQSQHPRSERDWFMPRCAWMVASTAMEPSLHSRERGKPALKSARGPAWIRGVVRCISSPHTKKEQAPNRGKVVAGRVLTRLANTRRPSPDNLVRR